MNAYSEDLRKKIVEAVEERGMSRIEATRTFGVLGISSVKRYVATYREGRSLAPKKRPGSKPKLDEGAKKLCWKWTSKSALRQRCPRGASSCGKLAEWRLATRRFAGSSSASGMMDPKKRSVGATERDQWLRAAWRGWSRAKPESTPEGWYSWTR